LRAEPYTTAPYSSFDRISERYRCNNDFSSEPHLVLATTRRRQYYSDIHLKYVTDAEQFSWRPYSAVEASCFCQELPCVTWDWTSSAASESLTCTSRDIITHQHTAMPRNYSFQQNAELLAEPQNLAFSMEFLRFRGILHNSAEFGTAGDKGTHCLSMSSQHHLLQPFANG